MDFISLAIEHNRFLRALDEMLGEDTNDDPSAHAATAHINDYTTTTATTATGLNDNGIDTTTARPLFSKNAEAELYLLATNFLLYVALVIVVILVCRIYFPDALIRSSQTTTTTRSQQSRPRSYNYRVAAEQPDVDDDDDEEDYGSEDDDEDQEDDGIFRKSPTTTDRFHDRHQQQQQGGFFDFQQESFSRKQVLQRLAFCCVMLNLTFVLWGALQERMLTRRYPRYTGEYFTYSYALVFTNRFWTLIMSGMLMLYLKPHWSQSIVIYEYSFPSISNMLSSWCQYEALRYVSFPATTLFKSFKLAPVMAMGKILGNKTYPQYDYVVALMIGIGIAMFMTSTDELHFGFDVWGGEVSTAWTGIMLLVLFLFFDSFTSQFQSRMFQRHQDLSMVELMFMTSAFSTVLSFVTLLHTQELYPAIRFVIKHSEIHLHFLLFSICSTIGQLFIFYTIKNFGAVVFTLIMTTRILLSIALSCVLYGHQVSATGFFGLMLVLSAVLYRIRRKAQGQQLLKWQGMEDGTKTMELVQEWHEHVEM